jgi:hypothetical protein
MARRGTSPDGSKVELRKSNRFPVSVPIEASWRGSDGMAIKEQAIAKHVNANGGFLEMANCPDVGSRLTLTNFLSAEAVEARVLANPYSRESVTQGIVVEFIVPNESFWGVNLQVKKASVELKKLEKSLQSEGIDLRLLNEFRDAVDYVRTASLAVQHLRDRQLRGLDHNEIGSDLAADRVRRATNLCFEVITDLDAERITNETPGVEQLYKSLEQATHRLRRLIESRQPERYLTTRI